MSVSRDRLTALYREYGPAIYARCCRILADPAAAEDATQETFMRVHRHLDRAPNTHEALRWIYRIATNYCLNELRNQKRRSALLGEQDLALEAVPSEDCLLNRDLGRRLMLTVSEPVGSAAWLHLVDGLSQAEVAEVLGVSRRTVVNYLRAFHEQTKSFVSRSVA